MLMVMMMFPRERIGDLGDVDSLPYRGARLRKGGERGERGKGRGRGGITVGEVEGWIDIVSRDTSNKAQYSKFRSLHQYTCFIGIGSCKGSICTIQESGQEESKVAINLYYMCLFVKKPRSEKPRLFLETRRVLFPHRRIRKFPFVEDNKSRRTHLPISLAYFWLRTAQPGGMHFSAPA